VRAARKSPGLDEELRIDADGVGAALPNLNGGLVHLFAFARASARRPV